ncbi:MAG TPA: FxSxx-COOH system tetratricopeptide repeat protein [Streptosporangiaceae bacterium]|nr:FxSxx-COOH system tetratricopeptide repeat protein [Streptosporangiaceae bacterium]
MIVTFYSYKGGVGRSMALANVADLMARSGLRVLMVDFDLEAPGLESFFPVEGEVIRGQEGLLDLLLTFKYSMSVASSGEENHAFRQLERFVATIYPARSDGGCLDLITAGQRGTDEQMLRYGAELRRFDWMDFYFTWSGELFFEWLRRAFAERYDVVLVDSRTGVTEMGGICSYQLADVIVVLCGPNTQNLDGTGTMIRHFLSPEVRKVRLDRPVDVLVVPARVDQQDADLRCLFEERFNERFASYLPPAVAAAGMTLWDLQIPYEPRYAFDEQVVTDPEKTDERRGLAAAYGALVRGIAAVAPDGTPLTRLNPSADGVTGIREPVETRYDPTTRFAGPDVYVFYSPALDGFARQTVQALEGQAGLTVIAPLRTNQDAAATRSATEALLTAKVGLVLVGRQPVHSWQDTEITQLRARDCPVLPVLLPGARSSAVPAALQDIAYLDLRSGFDRERLISSVLAALSPASRVTGERSDASPYPGLLPFGENDSRLLFGRSKLVQRLVATLAAHGGCALVGPARSGRTSVVFAGLVPALRQNAIPGSDRWPVVSADLSDQPYSRLIRSLAALLPTPPADDVEPGTLRARLQERFSHVVLVIDDLERLLAFADRAELGEFCTAIERLNKQRVVVPVFVLRPEFLDEVAKIPSLAAWFTSGRVLVDPLNWAELREAIVEPARLAGFVFEPGLVDRLLSDVPEGSAALPILQITLQKLWDGQRDGYLAHSSYEAFGGIPAVLIARSEEAVGSLSEQDLAQARTLLLRLVMVTDDRPHRRDAVELDELTSPLESQGASRGDVRQLIAQLAGHSIVILSVDPDGPVRVAIAHEALIKDWPRLAGWIDADLGALAARSRLDRAAEDWQRRDRDEAVLFTPKILEQIRSAMAGMPLSAAEQAYADAVEAHGRRVDFWLSYAGRDQDWADWIAWQLVNAGYSVELDAWGRTADRTPAIVTAEALGRADQMLMLFSAAYFQQWTVASPDSPAGPDQSRLVGLRVEPANAGQLPPGLRSVVCHDVFGLPEEEAQRSLLEAVGTPGRPGQRSGFPGRGTPGGLNQLGGARPRLPGSLPRIWNMPPRNPGFVGRDDLLTALREALLTGQHLVVQAVSGMSGVGTTQVTVEYAYRYAGGYDLAWWITAEQPGMIGDQLAALATELGLTGPEASQDTAARAALAELRRRDRWLLIFDNADSPADLVPWLPSGAGHVLITSRAHGWSEVAVTVAMDVLSRADSVALLLGRVPGLAASDANQLAAALGDLPLALAQAASYMAVTGTSCGDYLELLSTRAASLLGEGRPASYSQSLAGATEIDFHRLRADDPAAAEVVAVCACLAPEPIPARWFSGASWLPEATDPLAWRQVLARIGAHGLATVDQAELRMHRLVQAILRDYLGPDQVAVAHARAEVVLAANEPGYPADPGAWPGWARLLPHLLALDPARTVQARIRDLACAAVSYLFARGNADGGRDLAEALYEGWRSLLGPDDRHVLLAAEALAAALQSIGRYDQARELSADTLMRSRRVLGEDHPSTLAAARNLAAVLRTLGDVETARDLDEDTLARSRRILGEDHPDTLAAARNLSADLYMLGDVRPARDLDEDTLARSRRILGEDHPETLWSALNLSASLQHLGDVQRARQLDEDTLARSRRVLGEDHPSTLAAARSLAASLRTLGRTQAARDLDQDTLVRSRRVLGEDHPSTLATARLLAEDLRLLGDIKGARELETRLGQPG